MGVAPTYIGEYRKGDRIRIAVDSFSGSALTRYDIFDNEAKEDIVLDQTIDPATTDMPASANIKFLTIDLVDDFDTDGGRLQTYKEGGDYTVAVKSGTGQSPTERILYAFRIKTEGPQATFLGFVEIKKTFYFYVKEESRSQLYFDFIDPKTGTKIYGDTLLDPPGDTDGISNRLHRGAIVTDFTDPLVIGRTYFIRVKDEMGDDPSLDKLFSVTLINELEYDLKKLLALHGHNLVIDNFAYDQAGNITALRVRGFDTASGADNATASVTDPEPDEIFSIDVTQEHDVARNVRTFHKSVLEFISTNFPTDAQK